MDDIKKTGHSHEIIWASYSEPEIDDWRDNVKGKVSEVCCNVFWDVEPESDKLTLIRPSSERHEYGSDGQFVYVCETPGGGISHAYKIHEPREEKIIWKGYARFFTEKQLPEEFMRKITKNISVIHSMSNPWT